MRLNTWNTLSRGASPGPHRRGGSRDPITSLPAGGPARPELPPGSAWPNFIRLFSWQMAEGALPLYGRMTLVRTAEPKGHRPQDRGERAKQSKMGGLEPTLPPPDCSCPPEAITKQECWLCLRESRPPFGMGSISEASVDGFPWKPVKPCISTLASKHSLSGRKFCIASFVFPPWLIQQSQEEVQLGTVWSHESRLVPQGSECGQVTSPFF